MSNIFSVIKNKLKGNILFLAAILGMFGYIYILNIYYPLFTDDWVYYFMSDGSKIQSFGDIIKNQYEHYFTWGGRFIIHVIVQSLLVLGEGWADLLNSMVYVAMILTIYHIVNFNNKQNIILLILINILVWFFQPIFGQSILWITGSVNYLWASFFVFLFLSPYCSYYRTMNSSDSTIRNILFLLFGIIIGWTTESLSVATIFFIISLLLLIKYEKKKIPQWAIFGLIGAITGCIILIAAPGNYVRFENEAGIAQNDNASLITFYIQRLSVVLKEFMKYGLVPSIIYLATLTIFFFIGKEEGKRTNIRLSLLFFATSLVFVVIMIAAPIFPERLWLCILFFTISGITLLYANFNFRTRLVKILNTVFFIVCFLAFSLSYYRGTKETIKIKKIFSQREQYIKEQRDKGIRDITIHGKFISNPSRFNVVPKIFDMSPDANNWINKAYAKYHNIDSIRIISESDINQADIDKE